MRVFYFWGLLFLAVGLCSKGWADYPFKVEPVNYYDAGDSLSVDSQEYLLKLMKQRLKEIEKKFGEVVALELAVDEAKKKAEEAARHKARVYAMAGGAMGGAIVFLASSYFVPTARLGAHAHLILSTLAASIGSVFGVSAGIIWAGQNQAVAPKAFRLVLDGRGEEILKAAEDLSAQIRGMSVPRVFWSMRRLQDFTRRMSAFAALEHLLLKEINLLTDEMKAALYELQLQNFISTEPDTELADADLELLRSRIIRRFRELEYHTLKSIAADFEEEVKIPFSGIDYSKMTVPQCLAILRFLIRDESLPDSETELQGTLR